MVIISPLLNQLLDNLLNCPGQVGNLPYVLNQLSTDPGPNDTFFLAQVKATLVVFSGGALTKTWRAFIILHPEG
jgi:hypothetical protein